MLIANNGDLTNGPVKEVIKDDPTCIFYTKYK